MSSQIADKMEVDTTEKASKEIRGKWKSGRVWKDPVTYSNRKNGIIKAKAFKSTWGEKMKDKALTDQFKSKRQEIKDRMAAEKQVVIQARKEKEERRKINERKAEVVQVIHNVNKLKRAKKKLLRTIEKRDTNDM